MGLTPDTSYTFTQRMKETDNLTASDSQSVEGRTVADTGLILFSLKTIKKQEEKR